MAKEDGPVMVSMDKDYLPYDTPGREKLDKVTVSLVVFPHNVPALMQGINEGRIIQLLPKEKGDEPEPTE